MSSPYEKFLSEYSPCKTAQEYHSLRHANRIGFYGNTLKYDKLDFLKRFYKLEGSAEKAGIYVGILDWASSLENFDDELHSVAKRDLRAYFKLPVGKFSYVFTTENNLHTAGLKSGSLGMLGWFKSNEDKTTFAKLFLRHFKELLPARVARLSTGADPDTLPRTVLMANDRKDKWQDKSVLYVHDVKLKRLARPVKLPIVDTCVRPLSKS